MTASPGVLIDTSAWVDFFRADGDPKVFAAVEDLVLQGRACLADFVRLELWNGARSARDQRLLARLERELRLIPTSPEVWSVALDLARALRASGVTVPAADILIAATARSHGLEILHHDAHFDRIARATRPAR
ncbi:MAG: PIN domain-containing protein [Gemmatimonadota bacterium]